MKALTFGTVMIALVTLVSCKPQPPDQSPPTTLPDSVAAYGVSLDSASLMICHYDTVVKAKLQEKVPIRSFTIRATDLLEAMGVSGDYKIKHHHVRVYLGMGFNGKFRAFLTPVDGADLGTKPPNPGYDVILNGPFRGAGDKSDSTTPNGDYVLDFSSPCPTTCPDDSPLVKTGPDGKRCKLH